MVCFHLQKTEVSHHFRADLINICEGAKVQGFARGDYMELIDLVLLFLGHKTEGFSGFVRPGAMHQARWMAKLLYSFKIVLLKDRILDLPKGSVFTAQQYEKLERFVFGAAFFYVPWWLSAGVAAESPVNDLNYIKSVHSYSLIDPQLSESALRAFKNHLWYLTEELILLALFSSSLSSAEKEELVKELKNYLPGERCEGRFGTAFGKPQFPALPSDIAEASLKSFAGKDSWCFFRILKLDSSFLSLPVESWNEDVSFNAAKIVVDNLKVVNDSAERGVKLCSDFLTKAKTNPKFQNVLQVVENNRNEIPNQRLKKEQSKNWFVKI